MGKLVSRLVFQSWSVVAVACGQVHSLRGALVVTVLWEQDN